MTYSLLAIDIGNTALKAGCFNESQDASLTPLQCVGTAELEIGAADFSPLVHQYSGAVQWYVSSVNRPVEKSLAAWVSSRRPADSYRLLNYYDVPLRIEVDQPERVGFDRLATAVAAYRLRQALGPVIVVDIGTALKVHAVSTDGAFVGGTISPGLKLSARALANETDLLPLVPVTTNQTPPPVFGKNTEAAIRSGLYWGVVGAVRETIDRMRRELKGEPEIFVTGGDARGVAEQLGDQARYLPNLCLTGIACIANGL